MRTRGGNSARKAELQHPHPRLEDKFAWADNKKMRVVRHQNITADDDLTLCRVFGERAETRVDRIRREDPRTLVSVERHEPERGLVFLKETLKPRRPCRRVCPRECVV